jgi:NAD(P)-dependent dehydrogenase (short-subunit alcohol dehydrogenase family)
LVEYDFSNKIALIVGGTGAVGSQLLKFFSSHEATTIGTYMDEGKMKSVRSESQGSDFIRCNTLVDTELSYLINKMVEKYRRIDILVNTVGGFLGGKSVIQIEEGDWDNMFAINLKSAFLVSKHVIPLMIQSGYGRIVHISSYTGVSAKGFDSAYAAAKAGLIRFVESVSNETRDHDININCVLPSIIDTEANRKAMPNSDFKQWIKIEELAKVIGFLCSEESHAITGSAVPVLKPF